MGVYACITQIISLRVPSRSSRGEHLLGRSFGSSQQVRFKSVWTAQWRNIKESSNQSISFVIYYSEYYNVTTALRQSLVQTYASFFFNLPLALVFSPAQFAVHTQLNLLYQFWIHTGMCSLFVAGTVLFLIAWSISDVQLILFYRDCSTPWLARVHHQHSKCPSSPPRTQPLLYRQELCRHTHHLGSHVRHLR